MLEYTKLKRPPFGEVVNAENGKQIYKGISPAEHFFDLLQRAKFNVTMVPVYGISMGALQDNGTYDGIYGAVQSQLADTGFALVPITVPASVGTTTPVYHSCPNLIQHLRPPVKSTEGNLYDCLNAFGFYNSIAIVILMLLMAALVIWIASKPSGFNFLAAVLCQNFSDFGHKFVGFKLLVFILIIRALFGAQYSTDVTVAVPIKLIDSLKDLLELPYFPVWHPTDPLINDFKTGLDKEHEQVYNKVLSTESRVIPEEHLAETSKNLKRLQNRAAIFNGCLKSTISQYVCSNPELREKVLSCEVRVHTSKPFSTSMLSLLRSNSTLPHVRFKLDKFAMTFMQQKLFGNELERLMVKFMGSSSPECEYKYDKPPENEPAFNPIGVQLLPWNSAFAVFAAATVILLCEITLFRCRGHNLNRLIRK